jgi:pyruvate/2-oxoglutarate dehydrogenase complex dihydrolipoamide acyltransferase (E2) component
MVNDIIMPKMGESITEGTILEWRKKVGDKIELDEILLEIGTDKVDSEIPSSFSGTVVEILAKPNDVIEVGKVIARVDSETNDTGKDAIEQNQSNELSENHSKNIKKENFLEKTNAKPPEGSSKVNIKNKNNFFTPLVLKIASKNNISHSQLEKISGTGINQRVTKKDILDYLDSNNDPIKKPIELNNQKKNEEIKLENNSRIEEMPKMRKLISDHMKQSLDTSAHVYLMSEVDMTQIVNFVSQKEDQFFLKEDYKLTYTPFIVEAVVKSLMDYPEMNASLFGTKIHYHKNINIGLAVALENGLIVPSIANCEEKNFLGISRSINIMARKARENRLSIDEIEGSTFSITNFGVFGISIGTPIINQPNTGILGIGAIKKQPVVIESGGVDSIAIRNMMILSLGFDHRLIDGSGGAKFLNSVKISLEGFNSEKFEVF